jgi:MerR family transcriptional regulator, heat shock protein HspR
LSDESAARSGRGVYGISVASELSGLDPQSLRLYERRGLLTPARTDGGTRRYSDDDLARLHRITELLAHGINLAGIARILDLEARNTQLECDNAQLKSDTARPGADSLVLRGRILRGRKGKGTRS